MRDRDRWRRRGVDEMSKGSGFFEDSAGDARAARKTMQLCKEVLRTLSCVLGASRCGMVRDLVVAAVDPAPDASRLMVTLFSSSAAPPDIPALVTRLAEMRGALRAEVAASLQRKRAPDIAFRVAATS